MLGKREQAGRGDRFAVMVEEDLSHGSSVVPLGGSQAAITRATQP